MNCKECAKFNTCQKAKNPENYAIPECKDFKAEQGQMITMRDRLIELLSVAVGDSNLTHGEVKIVADYLLENGVIAPPVKVGDTVYLLEDWGYKKELKQKEVGAIVIKGTNDFSNELWEDVYGGVIGTFEDFGKTVFLSKEEAEKALKGGAGEC